MRRLLWIAALCALTVPIARASDDWGHDFDALIATPGAKVILGKANGHDETREIRLTNGVSFIQTLRSGKIDVFGNDNSGHGAVLCGIPQLMTLRNLLSICAADGSAEAIAEIDAQLDRIEDFIVVNRVPPQPQASKAELQSQIEREKAKVAADAASATPDKIAAICNAGSGAAILGRYREFLGDGKLKKWIDDLLSVPRPAVLNPCM